MDARSKTRTVALHRYNITKVTLFHTLHCRAADVLRMTCGVKQEPSPFPLPSTQQATNNAFPSPAKPARKPGRAGAPAPFPQNINRAILNFCGLAQKRQHEQGS